MTSNPFNESQNHQSPAGQRLDQRHREQLSALVDGELGADEARFLLRRMEHDPELAGCQERWQLLGDVMRGQASALAPAGFSAAVAAAIAAEPAPQAEPRRQVRRSGWRAWGGGAALAASVAAVALFIGGEKLKEATREPLAPQVIASQAELPPAPTAPAPVTEASVDTAAMAVAAAPAVAMAATSRRQDARRASATRSQQAARAAQRDDAPQRAIAAVQAPLAPTVPANANHNLPFGEVGGLQARPWPRSSLAPAAGGALNASFPAHAGGAAFYPFEPRLQDDLPVPPRPRD
ncbi:sigma-E factor negative regulatory protein [Stenotrophomonas maltophilia group sp. msm4]|uniref:sigma-E factor negative regulatory protein n=1 Tax=Stenotrophomonas maltophilia group sp. msm4 TaxID=3061100 RepID=UPI0028951FA2|nr:sigma-E factor negative regulatory protein [Stenotrophomonas maltophilia group sp. msm4]MDT3492689.1 sigma-E factor negative regulatory protein [Stenotrophomonas maltophilia group sp. msm4]